MEETDVSKRKTKIIATLGPSCSTVEKIVEMLDGGMDIARINMAHADHKDNAELIDNLKQALNKRPDRNVAIMIDTKGPEIRTGFLRDNDPVDFVAGQEIDILTDYTLEGDHTRLTCSYKALPTTVKPGDTILIADGNLACEVKECFEESVRVIIKNDYKLGEKKNMNLPGCNIDLPTLTEEDEKDIVEFGLKKGIDIVAASFIRKASDVEYVRSVLGPQGAHVKIIAKIENSEGLKNFDQILEEADGIMVARGDLGMELAPEKLFLAQKWMIDKCNLKAKPVITSTQMLESMLTKPRPTRAEAGDVANAVLDGTDVLMLSGETAQGEYPVNAVSIMSKIATEAEKVINYRSVFEEIKENTLLPITTAESTAAAAASAALTLNIDLIIVLTDTGRIARYVAKYRPKQPILACSISQSIVRQMNLTRGVIGYLIPSFQGVDNLIRAIIGAAKSQGLCDIGHKVIAIHGSNEESPDESNIMEVLVVE